MRLSCLKVPKDLRDQARWKISNSSGDKSIRCLHRKLGQILTVTKSTARLEWQSKCGVICMIDLLGVANNRVEVDGDNSLTVPIYSAIIKGTIEENLRSRPLPRYP